MSGTVTAILQARTGSTRLPGKVLMPILGEPMLARIIQRVRPSQNVQQLVVATTRLAEDDKIEALAHALGVHCFRGSDWDCLDRYYQTAATFHADVVVRLTGDNPLLDAEFVDWVVRQFLAANPSCDYMDSIHSRTFPLGLSVEVFTFEALSTIWKEDRDPEGREHVTPFIYRHPERFRVQHLVSRPDYSNLRLTVDTAEDFELICQLYQRLGRDGSFSWQAALALLTREPLLADINRHIDQKTITRG